ncbi:MAG: hypothetical protein ACR65X_03315, partial [Methylocystis sp.]
MNAPLSLTLAAKHNDAREIHVIPHSGIDAGDRMTRANRAKMAAIEKKTKRYPTDLTPVRSGSALSRSFPHRRAEGASLRST